MMPSLYDLKPAFQQLLRPLARWLARAGVTANQVTLVAAGLSALGGAALAWKPHARPVLLLLPAVLLARMGLNAIDGILAREYRMTSRLGVFLNEVGDVFSDAALYLPFAWIPGLTPSLVVGATLLGVISEMTGVMAVQVGASRRYDGPMGKSDRALAFGAVALLLGLGVRPGPWLDALLTAMLALLALTVVNRVRGALREAR